ncbi:kinesin-like protein KIF27 [Anguilla rostrata]|uniref:kinesin-like protein KIF27 n=1 Tax=Anguilla rostrata TaxID=7938 RepID=UPI0030D17C77
MAESRVKVAVRVRPLLPREALREPHMCVQVSPAHPGQVIVGNQRAFTFDFAFGPEAQQDELYRTCVQPLVTSLLEGYNATVFAYGQTGSGKTYTISGGPVVSASGGRSGIIPRAVEEIFLQLARMPDTTSSVRASYVEVYKEELRDLLELETSPKPLHIREDERGNTVLIGAREQVVESGEEFLTLLQAGNAARRTGSNQMNEHSSRSHALLTIVVTQRRSDPAPLSLASKFHLVDLAGSERLGSGASPRHFQESVQINTGLLALGNVIRALASPRRRTHVPYRDAKITRLLRDSLGGSARTLMIACVSPAPACLQESLSSLLFASRARDVRNQPTLNLGAELGAEPGAELRARSGEAKSQQARLQALQEELARQRRRSLQYRALTQEAAGLLLEARDSAPGPAHSVRVQEWLEVQEELENEGPAHNGDGRGTELGAELQCTNVLQLRRELNRCQEALAADEQLFSEREQQVKDLQEQVRSLQEQCEALLATLQHERNGSRLQSEQLVEQQLLIERLRDLLTSSTCPSARRPYSVPLITHLHRESRNHGSPSVRKVHTSPPAYSLERVMACFRTRSQLLKAQVEEEDQVLLQGREEEEEEQQGAEEEADQSQAFRRSLNLTWTRGPCDRPSPGSTPGGRGLRRRPNLQRQAAPAAGDSVCVEAESYYGDSSKCGSESVEACSLRASQAKNLQLLEAELRQGHTQRRMAEPGLNIRPKVPQQKTESQCSSTEAQLEEQRRWLEQEEERVLQQRRGLEELREELQRREELVAHREALSQERSHIHLKKLRSSQVLERDLLSLSARLSVVDRELEQQGGAALERLREEREQLCRRRDALDDRLSDGSVLTAEEEHTLFQVEEAIEVLDAVVEYKNASIHSRQWASAAPPSEGDMMDRLSTLPPPHIKALLLSYFDKVVNLREEERRLHLHCEELQLQLQEQVGVARELEAALQRLTLAADRRLTEQQREHQQSLQQLLHQLTEARGEGAGKSVRSSEGRIQELEKELFFYKSTSRQLRRKLRELNPAFSAEAPPSRGRGHESTESSLCSASAHNTEPEEAPPCGTQGRKRLDEEAGRRRGGARAEPEPPRLQARRSSLLSFQEDSIDASRHQGQ